MGKLSNYSVFTGSLATDDILLMLDIHDTTMSASGTEKQLPIGTLLGGMVPYTGATTDVNLGTHTLYALGGFQLDSICRIFKYGSPPTYEFAMGPAVFSFSESTQLFTLACDYTGFTISNIDGSMGIGNNESNVNNSIVITADARIIIDGYQACVDDGVSLLQVNGLTFSTAPPDYLTDAAAVAAGPPGATYTTSALSGNILKVIPW